MSDENKAGEGGNNLDRFESRLNQITSAVANLAKSQQSQQSQTARQRLQAYESSLDGRVKTTEGAIEAAEKALATAHDEGDGLALARAQRQLTEAVSSHERAKTERSTFEQRKREAERKAQEAPARDAAQPQQQAEGDDANLRDWKKKNASWYGVDTDMTKAALSINEKIKEAGVIEVGSKEYFEVIDRQMAQRYPDKFNKAPDTGGGSGGEGTRRPQSRDSGRVPQSVYEGWKRMGIDVEDPKVIDRMLQHREKAVGKGILPPEFVRERIM